MTEQAKKKPEQPKRKFFTEQDPQRNLPGGIYLDREQRREAEVLRARAENREPDLDNPPAIQSTPLIKD